VWPEAVKFFGSARRDEVSSIHVTHPRVTLMPYSVQDAKRNYVYAHGMIQRLGYVSASVSVNSNSVGADRARRVAAV
jgi:hypothetical protein